MLFKVLGYRKRVVYENLQNSFPEKTPQEIDMIAKKFYKHLCDLFLEVFKTLTISKKEMLKHCYFEPNAKSLLNDLAVKGKSVILVMGHQGNWEWAGNTFSAEINSQLHVIYHPITNTNANDLMYKMRTRFGTKLIAMKDTFKAIVANRHAITTTAFIADQTPSSPDNAYWLTFLNQDTLVFLGTERIALKMNYPIVYAFIKKVKRGYYQIEAQLLTDEPKTMPSEGAITTLHTQQLEKDIIAQPETWLWSHRRWKHKRT
jgi:KDO2-lipid IV(A) lauroyltransferase